MAVQVLKENEKMVYGMGSADPRTTSRRLFGGSDVKIKIDGEPQSFIQGISFKKNLSEDGRVACMGSLIVLATVPAMGNLFGKKVRLSAEAANEFGGVGTFFDETVQFVSLGTGVAVDDIVVEENYTFKSVVEDDE